MDLVRRAAHRQVRRERVTQGRPIISPAAARVAAEEGDDVRR
jgi:hypothetical protein